MSDIQDTSAHDDESMQAASATTETTGAGAAPQMSDQGNAAATDAGAASSGDGLAADSTAPAVSTGDAPNADAPAVESSSESATSSSAPSASPDAGTAAADSGHGDAGKSDAAGAAASSGSAATASTASETAADPTPGVHIDVEDHAEAKERFAGLMARLHHFENEAVDELKADLRAIATLLGLHSVASGLAESTGEYKPEDLS